MPHRRFARTGRVRGSTQICLMESSPFQHQFDFYRPPCGVSDTTALRLTPELLKIFYIARVLFSDTSTHRIKSQVAPLFDRADIFTSRPSPASTLETHNRRPALMDNYINLAKITSLGDIAHLLPRDHVIYAENLFYKKLANRELIKIDYEASAEGVASVDKFVQQEQVELKRSQKVYILFDTSTSMNGENFKKLFVSKAIALEYMRRVSREKPQLYFRTFHSEVGPLVKAATEASIHELIAHICHLQTGGGRITNIGDAIAQAIEDITSDPEMKEAEILVMTDGFGPIPDDLRQRLGHIKLHMLLIPDLDIEKILQLYPTRSDWEAGGPDGSRPMPEFWHYYSDKPPPMVLKGDEMFQDGNRSYDLASRSVKQQKILEILQGLNQVYGLQELCEEFIFVVISSIMGEKLHIGLAELEETEAHIAALEQQSLDAMNNHEKLQFLQSVNFLEQFLQVAEANTAHAAVRKKIKQLQQRLSLLQARILEDPWIRSMLRVDNIKIKLCWDMLAARKENNDLKLLEAFAFLVKMLLQKLRENFRRVRYQYKL